MDSTRSERIGLVLLTLALCTTIMSELARSQSPWRASKLFAPCQVSHGQKDGEIRCYRMATWVSTSPVNSRLLQGCSW